MKKAYLIMVGVITIIFLGGCNQKNKADKPAISSTAESQTSHSESSESTGDNNTQFEVGDKLFTISIPDFNVMPEGDISDENGNTWLILQSDTYDMWLVQLSLHNKASEEKPNDYSAEDLGVKVTTTKKVNYHNFLNEESKTTDNSAGKIYQFETDTMEGQIIFVTDGKVAEKEKNYFEAMIKSIEITD